MTGNNIHDNWDNGIGLLGLNGNTGSNAITNNTLTNNGRFGIELKLPDGNGSNISVAGNTIQWTSSFVASRPSEKRDLAGIAAFRRAYGTGNVDIPTAVSYTHLTLPTSDLV